jgi:hypothetical protein
MSTESTGLCGGSFAGGHAGGVRAAVVPVYNLITPLKITGKPLWWLAMFCVPFANFVVIVMIMVNLAKSFGKGTGSGVGLLVLCVVFFPILAFGDAQYQGPAGSSPLVLAPV